MNPEPRYEEDYSPRQVEAARRVLIDLGQILAPFEDCLVVVGGWTPDLLLTKSEEPHIGSIEVDLALDASKLNDGRYAELLKLIFDTKRYRKGAKQFQLAVDVDLKDGEKPITVEVDFLAPRDVKLKKNNPKIIENFRVLQISACEIAFRQPVTLKLPGVNVRGAANTVQLRVISITDFLVMKAHAIGGRDKPKDAYDLCYCLEHSPDGIEAIALDWKKRLSEKNVAKSVEILREKFASVDAFGPQQLVEFHNSPDPETEAMHSRRAFELVQTFLKVIDKI